MPVTLQTEADKVNQTVPTGTLVGALPANATTVTVNGMTFYVNGSDWYAPVAGTPKFVVAESQL